MTFQFYSFLNTVYLVKICPIFDGSEWNCLTRYQKILWRCSFGCKNLSNSICLTMKFPNCHCTKLSVRLWHIPAWSCGHTFSKHIVQKLSCTKGVAGQTLKQILTFHPILSTLQWKVIYLSCFSMSVKKLYISRTWNYKDPEK